MQRTGVAAQSLPVPVSQTVEVIDDFAEQWPSVIVANDKANAEYIVPLDRDAAAKSKTVFVRADKIAVFKESGDLLYSEKTRSVVNAVKDACPALKKQEGERKQSVRGTFPSSQKFVKIGHGLSCCLGFVVKASRLHFFSLLETELQNDGLMEEQQKYAILFAAMLLCACKMIDLMESDKSSRARE